MFMYFVCFLFFKDTATTEIYTYDTLFPYTTLFRSRVVVDQQQLRESRRCHCRDRRCRAYARQATRRNARCARPSQRRRGIFADRSEEHTSELQSLMRISYAVFCLKKKNITL